MNGPRRSNILGHIATVGALTACSRALGFVREMMQSRLVGAGVEQSAFTLAFAIPNMARRMFGEGALTAAFVPIFKGNVEAGRMDAARRLARAVMSMSATMIGAAVVLAVVGLTGALGFMEGLSERATLVMNIVRLLIPYMLFICAAAFGMGVVNALGRFAASALVPSILNVVWILALGALLFFPDLAPRERVMWIAGAILVAGALQMLFMFVAMAKAGVAPRFTFAGWRDGDTLLVWRNMFIASVGAGVIQINYALDQVLAQLASEWAAGVIGYSERLMELPLGVIGTAFGTVLLPAFSGHFGRGDVEGARTVFVASVRQMMFAMLPAAAGLVALAPEVTALVYQGGEFDAAAATRVSRCMACYALGLGFYGLQKALVPWFQAQKDMKTPLKVSVRMVALNCALNLLAVFALPEEWRHVGLAASTVVCAFGACVLLASIARRRNAGIGFSVLLPDLARLALAASLMGAAVFFAKRFMPAFSGTSGAIASLAAEIVFGAVLYFSLAYALVPSMRGRFLVLGSRKGSR